MKSGTIQVEVVVPAGCGPGSNLQVQAAGVMISVTLPPGVIPGQKISIEVPRPAGYSQQSQAQEMVQQQPRPSFVPVQKPPNGADIVKETVKILVPAGWHEGCIMAVPTSHGEVLFQFPPGMKATPGTQIEVEVAVRTHAAQSFSQMAISSTADLERGQVAKHPREHFRPEHYPNGDSDVVDASLYASLTFSDLTLVIWRKNDTVFRCDMKTVGPALFEFIDADFDGTLTIEEIVKAMEDPRLMEFVNAIKCPVLIKLFQEKESVMRRSFKKIDQDRSGSIDLREWLTFLARVQTDRLLYYKQRFLLKNRAYSGLGMEPGEPFSQTAVQFGMVRGFWDDFMFYASNQHPLFVMCYADKTHPYSVVQRRAEFLGALLATFFGAGLMLLIGSSSRLGFNDDDYAKKFGWSLVCVTLPTSVYRKIAYLFFVAPCFLVDKSKTKDSTDTVLAGAIGCSAALGYLTSCCCGLIFFWLGMVYWINYATSSLAFADWMGSIFQFWFIWFVIMLMFDFNPHPKSVVWFRWANKLFAMVPLGLVTVRIGRWHLERAKIHSVIRQKVEERGIDKFFLPDTQHHDLSKPMGDDGELDADGVDMYNLFN